MDDFDRISELSVVGRLHAAGGEKRERSMLSGDPDIEELVGELKADAARAAALSDRTNQVESSLGQSAALHQRGSVRAARFVLEELAQGSGANLRTSAEGTKRAVATPRQSTPAETPSTQCPTEFAIHGGGASNASAYVPTSCPRCSTPASENAVVRSYNFESSTGEMLMFGALGQVVRFLIGGSESVELLNVGICSDCESRRSNFKVLEWLSRIGGLALTAYLLYANSTPELPLTKRGIGTLLLVLSPLVAGAILALLFRTAADGAVGIKILRSEDGMIWLRSEDPTWMGEFVRSNPDLHTSAERDAD